MTTLGAINSLRAVANILKTCFLDFTTSLFMWLSLM